MAFKLQNSLDPLLRPKSVAILGASKTEDSVGQWTLKNLQKGGYKGVIYPINPSYDSIQGISCFKSVSQLPETPDLAIFAVSDHRIEMLFDEIIAAKIPAAVIFSSLVIDNDEVPTLKERIQDKIRNSGILVCGANGMGFYNVRDSMWACGFDSSDHKPIGNVSLISHSGSGMSGILDCEDRLRFNFAVSTGNELSVTMDQYLNFVLDLPETKAVGLFIETARNPNGFITCLEKAKEKKIPIVALKVGKTEKSVQLTVSHSGAIAGDDDTYDALFDLYGVQRVRDTEELVASLILFSEFGVLGDGHLVALHDSGGERQLLVDLAHENNVPLTELNSSSVKDLEKIIDPELPAINPLDVWSRGGSNSSTQYSESARILLADPGAAIEALILNRAPYGKIYPSYIELMKKTHEKTGKPIILVSSHQGSGYDPEVTVQTHEGYPILDGISPTLVAIKNLFNYRDFFARNKDQPSFDLPANINDHIDTLKNNPILGEYDALKLLADFGISVAKNKYVDNQEDTIKAALEIGYPVVLKTAKKNINHKTENNGVILNITNESLLVNAYRDLEKRIGSEVIVAKMIEGGQEMFLGVRRDPQFGPIILMGLGGIYTELFDETVFAIPPFNQSYVKERMNHLKSKKVLGGFRGEVLDVQSFYECASRFSFLIKHMENEIKEFDVNPLILTSDGCVAVDALVVSN